MKRMIFKHKEEKRKKTNQIIIGLILIFVMSSSVIGFAFIGFGGKGVGIINSGDNSISRNTQNSIIYNGFTFKDQNGFWLLNKNDTSFIFRNNPREVQKINTELKGLDNYIGKPLYISSKSVLAESEIYTNLAKFVDGIKSTCLENENCTEEFPIRTCEDNLIIIKEGNESITQNNNCVFIEGKTNDLVKLTDEFLFKILGVES